MAPATHSTHPKYRYFFRSWLTLDRQFLKLDDIDWGAYALTGNEYDIKGGARVL
jgi:hypothetical protein